MRSFPVSPPTSLPVRSHLLSSPDPQKTILEDEMITGVAFYADVESAMWDDASFEVKIAEVDCASLINSVMPHLGGISVNAKLKKKLIFSLKQSFSRLSIVQTLRDLLSAFGLSKTLEYVRTEKIISTIFEQEN